MPQEPHEVQQQTTVKGTTRFGVGQLSNPTPMWATWVFRIEFLLNKLFGVWLASQDGMDLSTMKQFILWAALIDGFVWGVGRFLGVSKDQFEG